MIMTFYDIKSDQSNGVHFIINLSNNNSQVVMAKLILNECHIILIIWISSRQMQEGYAYMRNGT